MKFAEVIGQYQAKKLLTNVADEQRIPHALMFMGPTGCGGLAIALAFAQYVLCENTHNGDACGTCSACVKSAKLVHPDVHFSFPTVGAKATSDMYYAEWRKAISNNSYLKIQEWLGELDTENKLGNITKDECVRIARVLSLKIYEGRYKILIMWLPEYLGKEGNRLLKMIEEPPENTLILLVVQDPEQILPTILSRTQLVKIFPLGDDEIADALISKFGITSDLANGIAQMSDGDYGEARKQQQQQDADTATNFLAWLRKCYTGNKVDMVHAAEKIGGLGREKQKTIMLYGLHFMREMLKIQLQGDTNIRLKPDEFTSALGMSKVLTTEGVMKMVQLFDETTYHIERNANPKILFMSVGLKVNNIFWVNKK